MSKLFSKIVNAIKDETKKAIKNNSRVLAITKDGVMSYCTANEENRGKGRCNHIAHQVYGTTEAEFNEEANKIIKELRSVNEDDRIKSVTILEQVPDFYLKDHSDDVRGTALMRKIAEDPEFDARPFLNDPNPSLRVIALADPKINIIEETNTKEKRDRFRIKLDPRDSGVYYLEDVVIEYGNDKNDIRSPFGMRSGDSNMGDDKRHLEDIVACSLLSNKQVLNMDKDQFIEVFSDYYLIPEARDTAMRIVANKILNKEWDINEEDVDKIGDMFGLRINRNDYGNTPEEKYLFYSIFKSRNYIKPDGTCDESKIQEIVRLFGDGIIIGDYSKNKMVQEFNKMIYGDEYYEKELKTNYCDYKMNEWKKKFNPGGFEKYHNSNPNMFIREINNNFGGTSNAGMLFLKTFKNIPNSHLDPCLVNIKTYKDHILRNSIKYEMNKNITLMANGHPSQLFTDKSYNKAAADTEADRKPMFADMDERHREELERMSKTTFMDYDI